MTWRGKVTSREGRVSRNAKIIAEREGVQVTSREGRVSRNIFEIMQRFRQVVTSREGRVSRNVVGWQSHDEEIRHVPRGTCE